MKSLFGYIALSCLSLLFAEEENPLLIPKLKSIHLSASEELLVNEADLQNQLRGYLEQPIHADDLLDLKQEIVSFYRKQHYPLMAVQIPEQDVTDGSLKLCVLQSKLGEVTVTGNCHFSDEHFAKAIRIQPGEPIQEQTLLNNLYFINRNPFHRANLVYSPGKFPNTTNLDLMITDRTPFTAYAGIDNTGLDHIQRTRLFAGCTWGVDQLLTIQYSMAPDIHKFFSVSASYILPLSIQHIINIFGGYSKVHASVPSTTKTRGYATQASFRYTIPLPATTYILQEIFTGFDFKRYNNTLLFVESFPRIGQTVNLTQALAGYLFGYEHGRNKFSFDTQLVFSPFQWIPDQSASDFESLNPFASHTYLYLRGSINYKLMLSKRFYWTLYTSGQLSNRTLLPSEQFGVGGYSTVRGYEERQLNGDYGLLAKTEFAFYNVSDPTVQKTVETRLELLAFLDYGLAANHHAVPGEPSFAYLLGAGPGLRYSLGHYLTARIDWGIKIHRDHFPGGWSMVHFSMVGSF